MSAIAPTVLPLASLQARPRPVIDAGEGGVRRACDRLCKRAIDLAVAAGAIVVLAPVLVAIAVAIRVESEGPALYRQHRRGLLGRHFPVWKFRTMRHAPEEGFRQASRHDARVTRLGRLLRRTSLDELPQLFNVLQGSMSIIGPRPHPIALDDAFLSEVPDLLERYAVKPGISGLAQVSGHRGETRDAAAMQARLDQDLHYIERWSLALDVRIALATLWRGWRHDLAW